MQTLVLHSPHRLILESLPEPPAPGPGEVRVRIGRIGICGTDLNAYRGTMPWIEHPRILGHELAVEVLETGEGVDGPVPGEWCAVEPYLTCGRCRPCRAGRTNCCAELLCLGVHTDGGMREEMLLPAEKCHPASGLSLDALALAEMLCVGYHAVQRSELAAGEIAVVLGLGPIGYSIAQFLSLIPGLDIVVGDVSETRVRRCAELMGVIPWVIRPDEPLESQWATPFSEPPTAVFDATGHAGSMGEALQLAGYGGLVVFVGITGNPVSFPASLAHRKELTTLNSRNATARDFRAVLDILASGRIRVDGWITHRGSLAAWPGVLEDWLKPESGLLKGVLEV